jgi:hypothetical protein
MSLQVRIWEGGFFSWYTYVELAAIERTAQRPAAGRQAVPGIEPIPTVVPVPGTRPSGTPMPSAAAEPPTPGVTIIR